MGTVTDDPRLRERRFVFSDRHDAGRQLGELIRSLPPLKDPVVLAIPAGGVPIGAEIARAIHAKFGLAIVRKIQIPGNTEAGFGAVTWDGNVLINDILRSALGLTGAQVESAVRATRQNVAERVARFSGGFPLPEIGGRPVFVADDGLASGFTMLAAVASIRKLNPERIIVAVPTASAATVETVARQVDRLVCLNIRSVSRFAVAEAYKRWHDLSDNEVIAELAFFRPGRREVL
ncbi:MAG TPA: phosphoribosyltransferase family protein [Methanoregula sp.]|nr:phosphoribosyltransferase family protein [Methanoregula sp.]